MNDTPKNVRQIGDIDISHKIYVEDYVITYTREVGEELQLQNCDEGKTAILLGHKIITDSDVKSYINGMVLIDAFDIAKESVFSNEIWSLIYDTINKYYNDAEVVGWLYIGKNIDVDTDKRLLSVHAGNFLGKNLAFMYYDAGEKSEEFYDYMNKAFLKRKGFYIYYQKNDAMHDYMVSMSRQDSSERDCDDHVVRDIRDMLSKRREKYESKKMMKPVYAASMFVAAVALLVGTATLYKYNTGEPMLPVAAIQTPQVTELPEVKLVPQVTPMAQEMSAPQETEQVAEVPEVTPVPQEHETTQMTKTVQETETPEVTPAPQETEKPQRSFYTVKEGDTLSKICEQIYSSVYYIEEIKKINGIDNENSIYAGQKLWLPDK